ncbi:PLP-dependent aminotransferase family protein [Geovibrio thiophilus]|uniref:PLP-dependent aminotransferase family protein n=1 Tax=Geovibrio thiophilus TaxID=139438 RepID=A0A3R5Y694_9BACT|nr:PLP-dependent aminotransferase family protein [Geovibrio thiophilus]QAR32663.1 PLP-dependent aminotransferase family protein [Geovibrio thiophilus]
MLYEWKADSTSKLPMYMQLANFFREKIKNGELKNGTKMPGREQLMTKLGISKTTLISAFSQLQHEGLLVSYPKSGYVITNRLDSKQVNWQSYIKKARHKTSFEEYRFWGNSNGLTNFSLSNSFHTAEYLHDAMKTSALRINEKKNLELTKYGLTALRESVVRHVERMGIKTDVENVLISSETIQRLYYVYESLLNTNSSFLYEQTNIINTISNIHSLGMNMTPIKLDRHGISVSDLEKKIAKHRCCPILHLDPTDQGPTGIVMSRKRRLELIELVDKYVIPVVEIDHSANIWHSRISLNPLKSLDTHGNVIYMGSMLKCYPFDFQLSWIIADRYLIEHFSNVFIQNGVKANFFMQIVADEMFRSGMMYVMMKDIKAFVLKRREAALRLCEKHLKPKAEWDERNCYFHFWLDFPGVNIRKIFNRHGIMTDAYPGYFFDRNDTSHILLCPASIEEEKLEETISRIRLLVEKSC